MAKTQRYSRLQIALHWLIFVLFVVALGAIEYRSGVPKDNQAWRDTLRAIHISVGLCILVFAVVRVGELVRNGAPHANGGARGQLAASLLHGALYLVMFALPISGIIFSQAGGRSVAFFGWELPLLVAKDAGLRNSVREIHGLLGNAVYALVGLHAAAALWHHFVVKDDTLRRMLPTRRS